MVHICINVRINKRNNQGSPAEWHDVGTSHSAGGAAIDRVMIHDVGFGTKRADDAHGGKNLFSLINLMQINDYILRRL
jgi:hypothetical protein